MYNMLGQKLCPDALRTIQTGKFEMPVPVTDGVYVVRVQSAYGVTTKKIGVNW